MTSQRKGTSQILQSPHNSKWAVVSAVCRAAGARLVGGHGRPLCSGRITVKPEAIPLDEKRLFGNLASRWSVDRICVRASVRDTGFAEMSHSAASEMDPPAALFRIADFTDRCIPR
jgi:hypothetical protein